MPLSVITFFLLYAGGLTSALLLDASWGIYLYQLDYFWNPVIRWWYQYLPELRYAFIIAVVVLISFIIRHEKYTDNKLSNYPQLKWLFAMLAMMIVICFYAAWPERHNGMPIVLAKIIAFIIIAYKVIDTPQKFEKLIWIFLVGNFYVGWIAHNTGRGFGGRLEGIGLSDGTNANDTGSVLITAVPILIFYIIKGKIWQKLLSLTTLAYILDGIVLVNSRGAFLGMIIGLIYMLLHILFSKLVGNKEKIIMVLGVLIATCLFWYLMDDAFTERMSTLQTVDLDNPEGEESSRVYFWKKTFDLVKSHPFGVGFWGYQRLSHQFLPSEMLTGGMRAVHSTYFQALAEYGYIGPIILFGYLVSTFNLSRNSRKFVISKNNVYLYYQNIAINAGLVSFLIAAAFIDRLYAEMIFWFPLFISIFYNIYVKKYKE